MFCSPSRHNRALPSFPTRRSSDLGYPVFVAVLGGSVRAVRVAQALLDTSTALAVYLLALRFLRHPLAPLRSEEHTSELQSRLHLVCRLLLEKKNKKNSSHT